MQDARRGTWNSYELPALEAITDSFTVAAATGRVDAWPLLADLEAIDPDRDAWIRALDRLEAAGYIEGIRINGLACPAIVTRVTERGLRAAGVWPSDADPIQILVQVLVAEAAEVEATEPEKAGRLLKAAEVLGSIAKDVGTDVIAKFAAKAAGLP